MNSDLDAAWTATQRHGPIGEWAPSWSGVAGAGQPHNSAAIPMRAGWTAGLRFRLDRLTAMRVESGIGLIAAGVTFAGQGHWLVGLLCAATGVVAVLGLPSRYLGVRGLPSNDARTSAYRILSRHSHSYGEIGVYADGQGYSAGLEAGLDLLTRAPVLQLAKHVARDSSDLSGVQLIVGPSTVLLFLRLEPCLAAESVAVRGGGEAGALAALVAGVDRMNAVLGMAGVSSRPVDAEGLSSAMQDASKVTALAEVTMATAAAILARSASVGLTLNIEIRAHEVSTVRMGTRNARAAAEAGALAGVRHVSADPAALRLAALPGGGPQDLTAALVRRSAGAAAPPPRPRRPRRRRSLVANS